MSLHSEATCAPYSKTWMGDKSELTCSGFSEDNKNITLQSDHNESKTERDLYHKLISETMLKVTFYLLIMLNQCQHQMDVMRGFLSIFYFAKLSDFELSSLHCGITYL